MSLTTDAAAIGQIAQSLASIASALMVFIGFVKGSSWVRSVKDTMISTAQQSTQERQELGVKLDNVHELVNGQSENLKAIARTQGYDAGVQAQKDVQAEAQPEAK